MRHLFETTVSVTKPAIDMTVQGDPDDVDGLNFLTGKHMGFVNKKAAFQEKPPSVNSPAVFAC